jgi:hypothetical protein
MFDPSFNHLFRFHLMCCEEKVNDLINRQINDLINRQTVEGLSGTTSKPQDMTGFYVIVGIWVPMETTKKL